MSFVERLLKKAESMIGVRETSRNRGPYVDQFIRRAGLDPNDDVTDPWCVAFVYWCADEVAHDLGIDNPLPRTASVWKLWRRSVEDGLKADGPRPGAIFCMDKGGGKGHAGLVERVEPQYLVTIEGNTDGSGGRDGDGVYRRFRRPEEVTLGFLFVNPSPEGNDA